MSTNTSIIQKKPISIWLILSFIVAAIGLYGIVNVFMYGQDASYGVTREVPWGLLIAGYVFMVVSSTGLCLISSLGHVFGFKDFYPIGKRGILLAISTLLGGFYIIFWDLGGPFNLQILRLVRYFIPFHYTSPILWMGVLYGLYLIFIVLEFYFLLTSKLKLAFFWGLLGFLTGISAHSNLGAVFSYNVSRPFWHGVYLPIYFILSALISGAALTIFIQYFSDKKNISTLKSLSKLLVLFLGIMLFFETWKTITSLYGHPQIEYQTTLELLKGKLATNYLVFEMGIGMILPFVLLLLSRFKSPGIMLISAFFVVFGIFFMRYDLVYAGQMVSVTSTYLPKIHILSYTPSLSEISIFISGIGVAGIIYFLGEKFFNLEEEIHS